MEKTSGIIYTGASQYGTVYLGREEESLEKKNQPVISLPESSVYQTAAVTQVIQAAPKPKLPDIVSFGNRLGLNFLRPFLFTISSGFIVISVFGLLMLFWPVMVQEVRYRFIISQQSTASTESVFPGFPRGDEWTPPNTIFSIVIPKIDAKAPIIPNVDPSDELGYMDALKQGVAHAMGTCFPGMDCRTYLFAHSTNSSLLVSRYNAVFYLLRKLEPGDQIVIYYYGKKILYEVIGKGIYPASDTQFISQRGDEEELILQTCDPPGTTINRLLVFARPKLIEYLR